MSAVGLVCVALALIAIVPAAVLLCGRRPPPLFRLALLALAWVAVAAAGFGGVGLVPILDDAGSMPFDEIGLGFSLPALPAALAAGAFLAAREVHRHI